jgi:hypothetical protein
VPGLPAAVLAARKPGHRLALRRLFAVAASARTHATLALPPLRGAASVWLDGRQLPVPALEVVRQEVEIGDLATGTHVLYLEVDPPGEPAEDPVGGELAIVRSDPCRISSLSVAAAPPVAAPDPALVTASVGVFCSGPRVAAIELWRLSGGSLALLAGLEVPASASLHVPLRVADPRLWTPATPSVHVLRAALAHEGRVTDDLCAPVPLRGYGFRAGRLQVRGEPRPLLAIAATFAPGPDLPGRAGAALRRWKTLGADAVVVAEPVPGPIAWLTDRAGLLLFAAPVAGPAGPSLQRRVELLEGDLASHPSFAGFVVTDSARPPRSALAVLTQREAAGTDATRAPDKHLVALAGPDEQAARAAWLAAREGRASGVLLPEAAARLVPILRRD